MNREKILAAAQAAPPKARLQDHREAVQALRDKGFTWREIADFLTTQGVPTDHTRVYRTFGETSQQRRTESRDIEISRITYLGERKTKKNDCWDVLEIELPSQLGQPITMVGHAWGTGTPKLMLGNQNSVTCRNPSLVIKTGDRFPIACIKAEFQAEGGSWSPLQVYIMPKWETVL